MAPPAIAPAWQQPYINLFKLCDVDNLKEVELAGDVQESMDRIIGKKVFKVRGLIPAANYIRLPKLKSQTLGLTGRFVYMQIKVSPVKVFVIHLEVVTADLNVHRISISSMYKAEQVKRKSSGIQIPFPRASHRWCVAAVDMAAALSKFTTSPFHSLRSVQVCSWCTVRTMYTSDLRFSLEELPRDMQLSQALDSSVFEMQWLPEEPADVDIAQLMPSSRPATARTSRPATSQTPPSNMASATNSRAAVGHVYGAITTTTQSQSAVSGTDAPPGSPSPEAAPAFDQTLGNMLHITGQAQTHESGNRSHDFAGGGPHALSVASALAGRLEGTYRPATPPSVPHVTTRQHVQVNVPVQGSPSAVATQFPSVSATPMSVQMTDAHSMRSSVVSHRSGRYLQDTASVDQSRRSVLAAPLLEPDPALILTRVNAFNGEVAKALTWPPHSCEVVFAAGSVVVAMTAYTSTEPASSTNSHVHATPYEVGTQRFFMGHTAHVVAIAFDGEGAIMATAQDGKQAVIRVWAFHSGQCLAILNGHALGLLALDVSQDGRALVGVGCDSSSRQTMVLWNISQLRYGGQPEVVARHATEYNIRAIKFSCYQEDQLVTCGRDNVRFYRLKNNQLRGVTVRMGGPDNKVTLYAGGLASTLGPNIFTDIAFESNSGLMYTAQDSKNIFVASAAGAIFQIDHATRTLLSVYQVHSAAINSLSVYQGFAVTGSDDHLLRVWPLDFTQHLMQAEHESAVSSVAVSPDGLKVAIGTETGSIGILDIPSHQYTTLLRSHTAKVNAVAVNPNRDEYCTVSSDGTIRVWSSMSHTQVLQFDAPGEVVTCAAYHPNPQHHELACGFESGRLRVFDLDTTSLLQEQQQHRSSLLQLAYSCDGSRLFTAGSDGGLCVYDVAQVYQPVKFLSAGVKDIRVCLTVSPDGRFLATISRDPYRCITSLLVFHSSTLEPYMRVETDTPVFKRLAFSPDGDQLWALAAPNRLDRYELQAGQLSLQVSAAHRLDAHALDMDPYGRFVVTAGDDGLVKLWAPGDFVNHGGTKHSKNTATINKQSMRQDSSRPMTSASTIGASTDLNGPKRTEGRDKSQQQQEEVLPAHQCFTGHPSAVLDAAIQGNQLITVGDANAVFVWNINCAVPEQQQMQEPVHTVTAPPGRSPKPAWMNSNTDRNENTHVNANSATSGPASYAGSPIHHDPSMAAQSTANTEHASEAAWKLASAASSTPLTSIIPAGIDLPAAAPDCDSIIGYTPSAMGQNVVWKSDTGVFAYAAGHLVILEDLSSHRQTYVAHFTQPVSAVAVTKDSRFLAAASTAPEPSGFAEILIWNLSTSTKVAVLQYHPKSVEALSFSGDGQHLLSIGRDPERSTVIWDLSKLPKSTPTGNNNNNTTTAVLAAYSSRCIAGVGRTKSVVLGQAWLQKLHPTDPPQYVTVGADGLLLWTLQATHLEQVQIQIPYMPGASSTADPGPTSNVQSTAITAVAVVESQQVVIVADEEGHIWEVDVSRRGLASISHMAHVPLRGASSSSITSIVCAGDGWKAAVGMSNGVVALYSRGNAPGQVWTMISDLQLGAAITSLCFEPHMSECVAATTDCTIWYCHVEDAWKVPLINAHVAQVNCLATPLQSLMLPEAPGSPYKRSGLSPRKRLGGKKALPPPFIASCAADGAVRVWKSGQQLEFMGEHVARAAACTCATIAPLPSNSRSPSTSPSKRQSEPAAAGDNDTQHSTRSIAAPGRAMSWDHGAVLLAGYEDGSLRCFAVDGKGPNMSTGASSSITGGLTLLWHAARHSSAVMSVHAHPGNGGLALTASKDGGVAVTDLRTSHLLVYMEHFVPGSYQQQLLIEGLADLDTGDVTSAAAGQLRSSTSSPQKRAAAAGKLASARIAVTRVPGSTTAGVNTIPTANPIKHAQPGRNSARNNSTDSSVTTMKQSPSSIDVVSGICSAGSLSCVDISPHESSVCAAAWPGCLVVFATPWTDSVVKVISTYQCPTVDAALAADVPALTKFVPGASKLVAYTSPLLLGKVVLFDYRTSTITRSIALTMMPCSMAISGDGAMMALGGTTGSAVLYDVESGRWIELPGFRSPVRQCTFTTDGPSQRLMTSSGALIQGWTTAGRLELPREVVTRSKIL